MNEHSCSKDESVSGFRQEAISAICSGPQLFCTPRTKASLEITALFGAGAMMGLAGSVAEFSHAGLYVVAFVNGLAGTVNVPARPAFSHRAVVAILYLQALIAFLV